MIDLPLRVRLTAHGECYATQAIIAPLALAVLNFTEGNPVTPAIVGKRAMLVPLGAFVAVAFGVWIWGIGGAFVVVSTMIVLFALCHGVLFRSRGRMANVVPRHAPRRRILPPSRVHLR